MSCSIGLITMQHNAIGRMSCNPAIGGTAKGHLVHEIDALGGVIGEIADRTGIQFKVLNKSKGPAVWSSRCQSDYDRYSEEAVRIIDNQENITVIEGIVESIIEEQGKIIGVSTNNNQNYKCKAIVICSGTFLNDNLFSLPCLR